MASSLSSAVHCSTTMILALALVIFSVLIRPSISIYCDEDDCYDLLGVSQNANASEIKKSYYKLSLKYHPDKNPDPDSKKLFVKVANAYEILKDESTRAQYDYALAHPEEVFYNTARYYQTYYGHKTDARAVVVGLLLILSAFQYLNQWTRYNQAIDMVKKTPVYKNKLRALEIERSGGITNKKKSSKIDKKKLDEDLSKDLDLQIQGAEKPSVWGLLGIRFILLPYTASKLLMWYGCWFWRYQVKHAPYTWEDASYLTRRSLGIPYDAWANIGNAFLLLYYHKFIWSSMQVMENWDKFATMGRDRWKVERLFPFLYVPSLLLYYYLVYKISPFMAEVERGGSNCAPFTIHLV